MGKTFPFGDLVTLYLSRKSGLSKNKLAAGILQDPSVISRMCQGKRLTGPQARSRVLAIIHWFCQQGVLYHLEEANGLLKAAGMSDLEAARPEEAELISLLKQHAALIQQHPEAPTQRGHIPQPSTSALPTPSPVTQLYKHYPNNLPAACTSFLGREAEVAAVRAILLHHDKRLLTLLGPPGAGKTRLALEVATDLLDHFEHGIYFVDLLPSHTTPQAIGAIAHTLAVPQSDNRPLTARLKEFLRGRQLLLILDNFEHVLAAAPLVSELLQAAAELKVIATSRSALRLRGEQEFIVPPLPLPPLEPLPLVEELVRYGAVRLFVERSQDVRWDFQVRADNAVAIAQICHRLDGLPLAIELAAGHSKVPSPPAMLA
ncbi:MAG: ATP-binding protein, partial [Ardenticatenaceae bacterium]